MRLNPVLKKKPGPGARFSKIPITFRAQKAVLCLSCWQPRLKLNYFWEWYIIQRNYQLTKGNWLICEPGILLLFSRCWSENLRSGPKSIQDFRETSLLSLENNKFLSRLSMIVRVNVVLNRTVFVDNDWRLDNLRYPSSESKMNIAQ